MQPKIIVICGAHSNVGKTTLANKICTHLDKAIVVKRGCGKKKANMGGYFYPMATPASTIVANHAQVSFLVLESNSVLNELAPDLSIYIDADRCKQSAVQARALADISTRNLHPSRDILLIQQCLGVDIDTAHALFQCIKNVKAPLKLISYNYC